VTTDNTGTAAVVDEESALVDLARKGDAAAFSTLVARYDSRVFRLARHILQNQEDAEDVLQEVFLKAYTHLSGFEGNSKFYTWLARITVNEALMKIRKRKTGKEVSLDEPIETDGEEITREIAVWDKNPEKDYSREELKKLLDEAIEKLTPIYRAVFLLRDVDELSTEETAAALDLSVPAVKSRLLRARLQLREILTGHFKWKEGNTFAYL
jgi:RNA polymerase sigma-70 factor (ECF subfamily)